MSLSEATDKELYAEVARRRAAKRTVHGAKAPRCACGECALCKQRQYRRERRIGGKDK